MKRSMFVLICMLAIFSCNDDDVVCGGQCAFDTIPGTAIIRKIVPDTLKYRICDNAVFVYFDFIPADSSAPENYKFPAWPDTHRSLLVADGKNPPDTWIIAQGLDEGTIHECVRLEELSGTCTPVLFEFSDVDYSIWTKYCDPLHEH